jgi:type II secretory pathway pseudopilin PulG
MMVHSHHSRARQAQAGVALIEVILAVALFGMAALGLLRALTYMSQASNSAKMELRMMQSTLTQFARQPKIEETARPIVSEPDESGVWTETRILEMNEKNGNLLQTDEGEEGGREPLTQMFQIIVTAYWELGGQRGEETAETFRYAPLFQQAAQ